MSTTNEAANVTVGKPNVQGAVYRAPLGTTLPTSTEATLNEAFEPMGYISDAGLTNSQTRETSEIKAWGGDVVLKPQNKKTDTLKMKFIEGLNVEVLKTAYGNSNVTGTTVTTGIEIRSNSKELDHAAWVIDRIYNGNIKSRTVIADGQPTAVEDVVYKDDEVVGFDTTIDAFPSSALDGDTKVEYIKKS